MESELEETERPSKLAEYIESIILILCLPMVMILLFLALLVATICEGGIFYSGNDTGLHERVSSDYEEALEWLEYNTFNAYGRTNTNLFG